MKNMTRVEEAMKIIDADYKLGWLVAMNFFASAQLGITPPTENVGASVTANLGIMLSRDNGCHPGMT